ncbi:hypothetical protein N665_0067s0034 [Sinapis alba]|nr:hypothetical protein N665_0067s0034 [Sinapis alba]
MLETIRLRVHSHVVVKTVKFFVINVQAPYNAIQGTPWIHVTKTIPSTYHQCIKFPGNDDQKDLLVAEIKTRMAIPHVNTVAEPIQNIYPFKEEILEVILDDNDTTKTDNISTFAWSASNMKGINPNITTHTLNVDMTFKSIRQKKRKAVDEEIKQLLGVQSINKEKYPELLANPVVVKKKYGKLRNSFPLPHIDRLVDSTAVNELVTFMDVFSGYNQIMLDPNDREKTTFITDQGTYCYKVMSFSLKNASTTYQCLVNNMFAERLGITKEVNIEDMIVKSQNEFGMKLNPTKCTFGVTSGEFLDYIVTQRGTEEYPKQIFAILDLPIPKNSHKDDRCEEAFRELEHYLTTPLVLVKPDKGAMLYLYIAVSPTAINNTLEIMALAVISSASKLRPYFQSHSNVTLTNHPLRTIMQNTNQSGRLSNRPATKCQVLADFFIKLPPELEQDLQLPNDNWILHVDRSLPLKGSEIGIQLQPPAGELLQSSFRLAFKASNNEAEYEALIAGLRLAKVVRAKHVRAYCDYQLVDIQFRGIYDAKNERMDAYLKIIENLTKEFESFALTRIPHALDSSLNDHVKRTIPIEDIDKTSIANIQEDTTYISSINPTDSMHIDAKVSLPKNKSEARRLAKSSNYVVIDEKLHRWTSNKVLLTCVNSEEPTMTIDCEACAQKCDKYQRHTRSIHSPTESLQTITAPYPFIRWVMDIIGPLLSSRQRQFVLIMTDYFTKCVEAEAFVQVNDQEKNIICRHGLPIWVEAMEPTKFNVTSLRRAKMPFVMELNKEMMLDALDAIEEHVDQELLRIQNYQHLAKAYYNKQVHDRPLELDDLLLRKTTVRPTVTFVRCRTSDSTSLSLSVKRMVMSLLLQYRESEQRSSAEQVTQPLSLSLKRITMSILLEGQDNNVNPVSTPWFPSLRAQSIKRARADRSTIANQSHPLSTGSERLQTQRSKLKQKPKKGTNHKHAISALLRKLIFGPSARGSSTANFGFNLLIL